MSINLLPKEVLDLVFSFLRVPDRLNASLVCRKWLDVMNSKSLLKDIKVVINHRNTVPIFLNMSRDFSNFAFKLITLDNNYYPLFECFSHHIRAISIDRCESLGPVKFDLTYENLKSLNVNDCDLWSLFSSVPNLSELYLRGNSTITDVGISFLQKTMKNLKVLSFYCNVSVYPKAYNRFYCRGVSYEEQPSSLILSLRAIKSFISERARTLKELSLYFKISPEALKEIATIENLCLTKICLGECFECGMSLSDLFKCQPSLKKVELFGLHFLDDDFVSSLTTLLPDVEEVSILNSRHVSNDSLIELFYLKNLKKLNITQNYHISAFEKAKENVASVRLDSLDLVSILLNDFEVFVKQCKNLLHLTLCNCKISNEEMHIITENLVHLQYLDVSQNFITDYGVTGFNGDQYQAGIDNIHKENEKCLSNLKPAQTLKLNGCDEIFGLENEKCLSNLKQLRILKLNHCDNITVFGFIQAIRFQYLEYLYIIGCHACTTEYALRGLLSQNPSIRKIYCDADGIMQDPRIVTRSDAD